ncbi:MAG: ATP citrate lyase citrate-binding domain-containing protein [Candidatus Altiarchaeota archaeon]
MAQRAIREYDGKRMISRLIAGFSEGEYTLATKFVQITPKTKLANLTKQYPWLKNTSLAVKPDQLIKRRGKSNLILLDTSWPKAEKWIRSKRGKTISVEGVKDTLEYFIVEPFRPHEKEDEYYLAIKSGREEDEILFYHQGGIEVGDVESKAERVSIPVIHSFDRIRRINLEPLFKNLPEGKKGFISQHKREKLLSGFIRAVYTMYANAGFSFLEINPLIISGVKIIPLDIAAKLDDTAAFENATNWENIEFPPPWGYKVSKEEEYIKELDEKTGASLKLTLLNPEGRVWTMVAGGGASVIYADTVVDLKYEKELANYGEYSGNPSEEMTYEYAKTLLDLMTRKKHPKGKYLIIGGGIANFTDVTKTFKGIIKALTEYKEKLKKNRIRIYVRRGGPNYKEGLKEMKELGENIGVPIEVYGPETHMTRIVSLALGGRK